ncbi:hypothetical protein E8E13_007832 [Curvularia kusanoi]|uniref:FAD-binding FR-type domain-containing protein n=1 Tax=Curvularia kusanoi TaxID=90978 RepID=A0A9P4T8S5_CURKU|nr:hypothetical protein E8E13_007832 [Curvularia kusanoi]
MAFSLGMSWNPGEQKMHTLLSLPPQDNPTSTALTPQASFMLQRAPLLAIGTLDDSLRPWTTLWGGAPGFSEPIGGGFVGTRTLVDGRFDPVVQALVGGEGKGRGEVLQAQEGEGKMVSGLAIDLVSRKRVKVAGRMAAGTLREVQIETSEEGGESIRIPSDVPKSQTQIQLVTKIDQSLGNCPKYLNQYALKPALVNAQLLYEGPQLSSDARALIDRADMFFLTTATSTDMDTNHRGGPPGFVRTISPTCIIYPEYSGNRLYQSLGNLQLNPRIGLTFPDYSTGDVLYTTGHAEILIGSAAAQVLPGTTLAVKINLTHTRLVQQGLPFRGELQLNGYSPYNPLLRTLASEGNVKSLTTTSPTPARLVKKTLLTPDIARFTFSVTHSGSGSGGGGVKYVPGQWVALSFKEEMDQGWSHMRNDDPRSLNDDFVRTFTISSVPQYSPEDEQTEQEFDITIRRVGPVTDYLFKQNERSGFEVPVLGIGGSFIITQDAGAITPFIAAGVGITPLLGQLGSLELSPAKFRLFWTLRAGDLPLALSILDTHTELARVTSVFVTGKVDKHAEEALGQLRSRGVAVHTRRLEKKDLETVETGRWYLCAGKPFRAQVLGWLEGREVVFEGFDY